MGRRMFEVVSDSLDEKGRRVMVIEDMCLHLNTIKLKGFVNAMDTDKAPEEVYITKCTNCGEKL